MKSEKFRRTLVEVTFVAYDKQQVEYFWDVTKEQACNYIWKNILPTAIILFAWEYNIESARQISVEKKKLTDEELIKFYKK